MADKSAFLANTLIVVRDMEGFSPTIPDKLKEQKGKIGDIRDASVYIAIPAPKS